MKVAGKMEIREKDKRDESTSLEAKDYPFVELATLRIASHACRCKRAKNPVIV